MSGLSDDRQAAGSQNPGWGLIDLPHEFLLHILMFLRPSDILRLCRVSMALSQFIQREERRIASAVIPLRYPSLARCFLLPMPVASLSETEQEALRSQTACDDHEDMLCWYKDLALPSYCANICICLACTKSWIKFNIILDLSHEQYSLDRRRLLPTNHSEQQHPRHATLNAKHHAIVARAVTHPLA